MGRNCLNTQETLWRVIYMARGRDDVERVGRLLDGEGFLVRVRSVGKAAPDGLHELIALESEAAEARKVLMEKGL